MELTRRQRNDIFEALQAKGVDPADCELSEYAQASARRVFRTAIRHPPTKSIFLLNMQGSEYRFRWGVPDGLSSGPSVECLQELGGRDRTDSLLG